MRWQRQIVVGVVCAALLVCIPSFADYSGSLTSEDGGLDGREEWIDPGHSTIEWSVVWSESNNAYQYDYTFSVPEFAISHMIIEVSDDFIVDDIWDVQGEHGEIAGPDTYTGGGGDNPNMPGSVYGIKFDEYIEDEEDPGYLTANASFLSRRNPVWSDFYAKCGGRQGIINEAWNAGFADTNPLDPPSDGSINNHILAPNGYVPEPATTALFGLGLAGLVGAKLRKRRED